MKYHFNQYLTDVLLQYHSVYFFFSFHSIGDFHININTHSVQETFPKKG